MRPMDVSGLRSVVDFRERGEAHTFTVGSGLKLFVFLRHERNKGDCVKNVFHAKKYRNPKNRAVRNPF